VNVPHTCRSFKEKEADQAAKIFISCSVFLRHRDCMGKRREARERAVQFLFQHELNPPEDLERALNQFWETQRAAAIAEDKGAATWGQPVELPPPSAEEAAVRLFADPLIRGTLEHRDEADDIIRKHAKNWELHRIAAVDRNILRLAIYEMRHRDDIPPVVSINEAVDIAKKFSTQDSGKFVNGILDKVKSELLRPARIVK
jgi:transcription antitermination protein NusB